VLHGQATETVVFEKIQSTAVLSSGRRRRRSVSATSDRHCAVAPAAWILRVQQIRDLVVDDPAAPYRDIDRKTAEVFAKD
jgi:hypothetical protein